MRRQKRSAIRFAWVFLTLLASVTAHAQSPVGPNRPASVPDGYLITPFGYFHPSCVREVAQGDTLLSDVPAIQHANGAIEKLAACQFPRFTAHGDVAGNGEASQPAVNGAWIENANTTADANSSYGEVIANWTVPPRPTTNHGQTLYFFPGLEETTGTTTILQPVLAYQGSQNGWDLASWNCCPANITTHSQPIPVKPGHRIRGAIRQRCPAGTKSCPTWNVVAEDVSSQTTSDLTNTTSNGHTFNWAFGGVLEVYNIAQCSDYPPNGQFVFSGVSLYDYNLQPIQNPEWSPTVNAPADYQQCGFAVQAAGATVGVDYAPFFTLHSFNGTDGANPAAGLAYLDHFSDDLVLAGTTYSGGASNYGTVFSISPSGAFSSLHSFTGPPEGQNPNSSLDGAIDGNLYGTTVGGGANGQTGTIFKMTPQGELTTLYSFCAQAGCADGELPLGGLYVDIDLNIFGTTSFRGPYGKGSVYEFSGAALNTLYGFCAVAPACLDGQQPGGGLSLAGNSTYYGTTQYGGSGHGEGTIFSITTGGALTTLYNFCSQGDLSCTDGAVPAATLLAPIFDNNVYGTTSRGGNPNSPPPFYQGVGTVFQLTPAGVLNTLHTFCSLPNCTDGAYPNGGLIGSDGTFYGVTTQGGAYNQGTVYRITSDGVLTTLYSFCPLNGCADGAQPYGTLMQLPDGCLYGTTYYGGKNNLGTVFRVHP